MNIIVSDEMCWVCGTKLGNTIHHAIPQYLRPKHNVKIPICKDCHTKINKQDIGAMYAYIYKLTKMGEQVEKGSNRLRDMLEKYLKRI